MTVTQLSLGRRSCSGKEESSSSEEGRQEGRKEGRSEEGPSQEGRQEGCQEGRQEGCGSPSLRSDLTV